jgi:hypothetical protein
MVNRKDYYCLLLLKYAAIYITVNDDRNYDRRISC